MSKILNDSSLPRVYLIVDALDECDSGLSQLLDTIALSGPESSSQVKWLVASYNRPDIKERLRSDGSHLKISLELNLSHILHAINTFIDFKVWELVEQKKYNIKL